MTNPVVNVNVNITQAPAPSTLQKSGAFLSQGGTITSAGTKSLLTQLSDLTALLKGSLAISSITWLSTVATVTTAAPHGFLIGDTLPLTIAGCTPTGYNGTFVCTITGASTFTYALATNPGSLSVAGVYTEEDVAELVAMATTFFAQGTQQAVWVLELGPGNASDGVAFLSAWITANPGVFYSYLVPRYWDANTQFLALLASFEATTSRTYFFITSTLATYQNYTSLMKCALVLIEAPEYGQWPANVLTNIVASGGTSGATTVTATTTTNHDVVPGEYFALSGNTPAAYNGTFLALLGTTGSTLVFGLPSNPGAFSVLGTLQASLNSSAGIPVTEFSLAAIFRVTLNYAPSSTNRVTPLQFAFVFGVTPFPTAGNNALITTLLAAGINLIGTGAQGGISSTIVLGGSLMDSNPFKYWYSIDWVQINLALNLTAALIAGANNPQNPVDYNQDGINVLEQSAVSTMSSGVADGLVLNPIRATSLSAAAFQSALDTDAFAGFTVVNADPFPSYVTENPNNYAAGIYNGIAVDYAPLRGFQSITVNVNVTNFAS
jgi:hypothetical protein